MAEASLSRDSSGIAERTEGIFRVALEIVKITEKISKNRERLALSGRSTSNDQFHNSLWAQLNIGRNMITQANDSNVDICLHTIAPYLAHVEYCSQKTSADFVMNETLGLARSLLENDDYLGKLVHQQPLLAVTAAQFVTEPFPMERRVESWFSDMMDEAMRCDKNITDFFGWCRKRMEVIRLSEEDSVLLRNFLSAFEKDINELVTSTIHMGCCFASHLQKQDCATCMSTIAYPQKKNMQKDDYEATATTMAALGEFPIYKKYFPAHHFGLQGRDILIPAFTSAVDLRQFLSLFGNFWKDLLSDIRSDLHLRPGQPKQARITCHPVATREHEARIRLARKSSKLSIRIDKQKYDGMLGMDIGGIGAEKALQNAVRTGEMSARGEIVMGISNTKGSLNGPRGRNVSIMENDGLNDEEKAAAMTAVLLERGTGLTTRSDIYSYHKRGHVNTQEFRANFAKTVSLFGRLVQ